MPYNCNSVGVTGIIGIRMFNLPYDITRNLEKTDRSLPQKYAKCMAKSLLLIYDNIILH